MADFKVGDRMRATLGESVLVGEVVALPVADELEVNIGEKWPRYINVNKWQIEKVSPPLPTKVGAIVRRADGDLFVRDASPQWPWVSLDGVQSSLDGEEVSQGGFEVIFEGVDQ